MGERSYLSIGQVLDLLKREFPDLTISKIRFLESQGLLDPERTPSGYRKFYDNDIDRLRFILREQQENYLPLKVIKGRLGVDAAEGELEQDEPLGGPVAAQPSAPASTTAVQPTVAAPAPRLELVDASPSGLPDPVTVTLEELSETSGLTVPEVTELERFGLLTGRRIAGTTYYDADCVEIVRIAASFRAFGVEARHLRMYRTAVEREASFFEQVVTPMLKQRNPQSRRTAVATLLQMSQLGQGMRAAVLRQALRDYIGGP